jgi:hypothetical protein
VDRPVGHHASGHFPHIPVLIKEFPSQRALRMPAASSLLPTCRAVNSAVDISGRRMATAPSKMSWISERAPTPSGGPKESAHLHTTPRFPASR